LVFKVTKLKQIFLIYINSYVSSKTIQWFLGRLMPKR